MGAKDGNNYHKIRQSFEKKAYHLTPSQVSGLSPQGRAEYNNFVESWSGSDGGRRKMTGVMVGKNEKRKFRKVLGDKASALDVKGSPERKRLASQLREKMRDRDSYLFNAERSAYNDLKKIEGGNAPKPQFRIGTDPRAPKFTQTGPYFKPGRYDFAARMANRTAAAARLGNKLSLFMAGSLLGSALLGQYARHKKKKAA